MRNPDLPKLLKAIANSDEAQQSRKCYIYEQAAIELEKLEKIYRLVDKDRPYLPDIMNIIEILHEAP